MARIKSGYYFLILLFALVPMQAFAERPLENASYSEGMKAIKEMHVLNSLGLAGELIGIYKALNQASYAAAILHNRKWRPGEDDLSWVDDPDYGKIRQDPFAGLRPSDKHTVKLILSNIQYENRLLESGNLNSADKKEALLIIQGLVKDLKRKLANYPDFYAKTFRYLDLSGQWKQKFGNHSSVWVLSLRKGNDHIYDAVEQGLGGQRGIAKFKDGELVINWGGKENNSPDWKGVYSWVLNEDYTKGSGTLHFYVPKNRKDEKSTVKRLD